MQTSFSKNSTYISCPKHWWLSYIEKYEATQEGASTYFGSAIDAAVTDLLNGKSFDEAKVTFYDRWNKSYSFGESTQIFDNDDIIFGYKDFDADLFEPKDLIVMENWAKQSNLAHTAQSIKDIVALYSAISKKKRNPYLQASSDEMKFFNRVSWLSMKRKGKILLKAFHEQFMPKVRKVVSTQQRATLKDPNTNDSIIGYIDMVLEIDGYSKPVIFDLKTAGQPYDQEDIDLTQQLTLYAAMKGQDYNTDLVGYVVLCKNIPKTTVSTCKSCGNTKNSRHKTCDALVGGKRCGGEWDEKVVPSPEVQVLVEKKTPQQVNDLLLDIGNIVLAMKNEIVYKNVSKCTSWFGGICPYFNACHKNDFSGLVKKGSSNNNGP